MISKNFYGMGWTRLRLGIQGPYNMVHICRIIRGSGRTRRTGLETSRDLSSNRGEVVLMSIGKNIIMRIRRWENGYILG